MPKRKYHTDEERKQAKREYDQQYREANKERYAEHARNWRKCNPERAAELDAQKYEKGKERNRRAKMLQGARERAVKHNLPFDITIDDIIIPAHCPVLGIELKAGDNNTRPELDRVKPELGYVKGNVQVISGRANRIKWNATLEELAAIYNYVKQKESN